MKTPITDIASSDRASTRIIPSRPGTATVLTRGRARAARHGLLGRVARRVPAYLALLVVAVVYLYPLLYTVNVALKSQQDYFLAPSGLTTSLTWSNFSDAWQQAHLARYFGNTILYTATATIISVVCSVFVAFPIARNYVRWGGFWYMFFVASLFMPNGLIPQFQLMLRLHLYNTQAGYILLVAGVGLGPFLIAGYLRSIPRELDESAAIDGCGYIRHVLVIILPLLKPILVTAALLQAINVWNDIIGPTIYLSDQAYWPVTLRLFTFSGQFSTNWPLLAAAILIVASPIILLYLFLQRYIMDGALAGAIK